MKPATFLYGCCVQQQKLLILFFFKYCVKTKQQYVHVATEAMLNDESCIQFLHDASAQGAKVACNSR